MAGQHGVIRLWDPATRQPLLDIEGPPVTIHGLAFDPEGKTLASASHDGAVRLWRSRTPWSAPADRGE